jgi:RNA polymerase primary sigma factor
MELNDRIRALLELRGWNQKQLAELIEAPASLISYWVNGTRMPDDRQQVRLADAFGVEVDWLARGEGPEPLDLRDRARSEALGNVAWIPRMAPRDGGRDGGNANQFTIRASLGNLVRETIQNPLDEPLDQLSGPVKVRFRLLSLRDEAKRRFLEAMRWDQLRPHVEACIEQAGDQQVAAGLEEAMRIAQSGELLILQIADSNTRGLIGPETGKGNFAALTRDNLYSEKNSEQAGGSYGLGKAMQYSASAFGCVLFASELSEPEPETEKVHGRLFARAELVYHELDNGGGRFSGPTWLGRDREPNAGEPVSYWADGENDRLLRDLHMIRAHGDTGTTIAIVGMRDLDADRARPPREIVEQIADEAECHFWPAIEAGELEVRAQYVEISDPDIVPVPEFDRLVDPAKSRAIGPYVAALRAYRDDQTEEALIDEGDVVCVRAPLNVPARVRGEDRHPKLTHEALLLVRRATIEEEADEDARRELRRAVLTRGSRMRVKTLDLARGALGAQPFQVVVLAGLAAGDKELDRRAEVFLRASEPPSHDDWEYTARLRGQYERGARKALIDFEQAIRSAVRRVLMVEPDLESDGPRDLSQRFKFGDPPPPERAPRIVVTTQSVADDGAWQIEAAVRLRGDLRRRTTGRPQLVFVGESKRKTVRWSTLEPIGGGIVIDENGTLIIAPQTRTARFRGVTDPASHPAPARQATATLLFQPTREEA